MRESENNIIAGRSSSSKKGKDPTSIYSSSPKRDYLSS